MKDRKISDVRKKVELKNFIKWTILVSVVIFMCRKDTIQQQQYEVVRQAHSALQREEYEKAISEFQSYVDGHTEIYWKLIDFTNDEQYGYRTVKDAIYYCEEKLQE